MTRTIVSILTLFVAVLILSNDLVGQIGHSNPNLRDLPVVLSWNDDGIRITAKTAVDRTTNLFQLTPSRFLEQIGNDLIRIAPGDGTTPVIVDLSGYYERSEVVDASINLLAMDQPRIKIHMPKLTLSSYSEPNSFIVELRNYSSELHASRQLVLFRGLDVFYVGTDRCANLSANQNRIVVDVDKCEVKHLALKGGLLNLTDIEEKIPTLCQKYNDRYFIQGQSGGFICLEDCRKEDPNAYQNLKHGRGLVTKYNITDFQDAPVSFLDNMLITKKGIGLNLKTEAQVTEKRGKKGAFSAYDSYRFFPWHEFINLSFAKYIDENQLSISDPYNNRYIYNSKVHFSNVELIQFFNELKAMISAQLNQ